VLAFAVEAFDALALAWEADTLGEEPPPCPVPWLDMVQPATITARQTTPAALPPARRAPRGRPRPVTLVISSPRVDPALLATASQG